MKSIHIDLHLPSNWNDCTTSQLETIAATLLKHTLRQDRYHPFDWTMVKAELFFLLTGVKVLNFEGTTVTCQYEKQDFTIETWQIHSWCEELLKWVDDPKQTLVVFPYKTLLPYRRIVLHYWHRLPYPVVETRYHTPGELLQDFSWRQYRYLQEYMELFADINNQMANRQSGVVDKDQIASLQSQALEARSNFLAVLFHCEHCPHRIRSISEVQWQVILFWWNGLIHYLQKQYPHCFKPSRQSKRNQKRVLPLNIYVSIVATMQKYVGLDEEKVNQQTFHIVLEQLERIAKENEEMEKMKKK